MTLDADYRRVCSTPSDIVEHLPRFVELVKQTKAQHVIELGTRSGTSTIAWLYGLSKTKGRLTSVDIAPPPDLGNPRRWTFHQSDDLAPDLLALLEPADIVFIDTSHVYEHTAAELDAYLPLVKPGGFIVCHDTELAHPQDAPLTQEFPVRKAIEEFVAAHGFDWSNNPRCWGLAEIKVVKHGDR